MCLNRAVYTLITSLLTGSLFFACPLTVENVAAYDAGTLERVAVKSVPGMYPAESRAVVYPELLF